MVANFLENSRPFNYVIYLFLFFCFFWTAFISTLSLDTFTWVTVFEGIAFYLFWKVLLFFYHQLVVKNKLTLPHSYSFFFFIILVSLFMTKLFDFKVLLSALLYLIFLIKIYNLHDPKKLLKNLFDGGFYLGILCIIEPTITLFFGLLLASVLVQKITIRTLFTPIIGFLTPFSFYFIYFFWNDAVEEFTQLFYFEIPQNSSIYTENANLWVYKTIISLIALSILLKTPEVLISSDAFKKSWVLLILHIITAAVFTLIIPQKNGLEIVFLLIPTSIIVANGFDIVKNKFIKNTLLYLILIGTIISFFEISIPIPVFI